MLVFIILFAGGVVSILASARAAEVSVQGNVELRPGFNAVGVPVDPAAVPDTRALLPHLGTSTQLDRLLAKNPVTGLFEATAYDQLGNIIGAAIPLRVGEAWIVYAKQPVTIPFNATITCPHYDLQPGIHLLSFPFVGNQMTAYGLLERLGGPGIVSSIQGFNPATGLFETAGYQSGTLTGPNFPINPALGYFVTLSQTTIFDPIPVLSTLTPSSVVAGGGSFPLTLTGKDFVLASTITVGSTDFSAVFINPTQLTVSIPATLIAATGSLPVTVTSGPPGCGTSNAVSLQVQNSAPVITRFTPTSGPIGTAVTIEGTGFDPVSGNNRVAFNGVTAIISSVSTTQINTTVPMSSTTGPITITSSGVPVSSPSPFTVLNSSDFSIEALPHLVRVVPGETTTYQIRVNNVGLKPLSGMVKLAVSNLPNKVTGNMIPAEVSGDQKATLFLTADTLANPGTFNVTVTGTASIDGHPVTQQSFVQLTVVPPGATSLSGRILASKDDQPLVGAKLKLGGQIATTDESGNFFMSNPPIGEQILLVDGPTSLYPEDLAVPATIIPNVDNHLPYTVYLHEISQNFYPISSGQDITIAPPEIPDFVVMIPRGTVIMGWDGVPNTKISITPVPIDRLGVRPIPPGVNAKTVYMFSFGKPGGGFPNRPVPIIYPNDLGAEPGERIDLWYYDESPDPDPNSNQWKIYGQGTVSQDGKQIIPDPGVGQPKFCCGASFPTRQDTFDPPLDPPGGCPPARGGDPVSLSSGVFIINETDLFVPGIMSVRIERTYRTLSTGLGVFGIGGSFNYDLFLPPSGSQAYTLLDPEGGRYTFSLQPDGTYSNGNYPFLSGTTLTRLPDGRTQLRARDGSLQIFNSTGWLVEERDRNNNRILINRDPATNRITEVVDPSGRVFTFDSFRFSGSIYLISSITDPIGRKVQYGYDGGGRLITVTNPAGGVTTYTYDANNRMVSIKNPRGITEVTNEYDSAGRVIRQTHADGGIYTFRYTLAGNTITQTELTDPNGNTTTYRFNGRQYVTRVVDALGQMNRYDLDFATNQCTVIHDPLERTTRFTYDLNGNRTSVIDPAGNLTLMEYEPVFNQLTKLTDPLGNVSQYEYDARGNLTAAIDPLGHRTTIAYNTLGQPVAVTDSLGNISRLEYDANGNLSSTTDPLGNTTTPLYDAVSRLIKITDANGKRTELTYDALDRVTETLDVLNGKTQFSYDPNGNILFLTDAKNQTTSFIYDVRDQLLTRADPLNRIESYLYDVNGNMISMTDRKGQVTNMTFDALNRVVAYLFADGSTTSISYDPIGRAVGVSDSLSGPILYQYDSLDRMIQETTPLGDIQYEYDSLGRRTSMGVPGRDPVNYSYDRLSRLTEVSQNNQIVGLAYDDLGRRIALTYPNGAVTTYGYDAASRLTEIIHQGSNAPIESLSYRYDPSGNRIGLTRANGAATLVPDAAQADYDVVNEQVRFNSATDNLTYDANGNLVSFSDSNGTTIYSWDARDRLTEINGPGVSAVFRYDALGRRINKTVNGVRTDYLYDGDDILVESKDNALTASYLRSLNIDEPFLRQSNTNEYYHADGLNSVVALTDDLGSIQTSYAYEPYGRTLVIGSTTDNSFQYTGRENDGTGLYFYRARYYSSALMRFIQEDPIGFESGDTNLFAYVGGNPVTLIDPLGTKGIPANNINNISVGWRGQFRSPYRPPPRVVPLGRENGARNEYFENIKDLLEGQLSNADFFKKWREIQEQTCISIPVQPKQWRPDPPSDQCTADNPTGERRTHRLRSCYRYNFKTGRLR